MRRRRFSPILPDSLPGAGALAVALAVALGLTATAGCDPAPDARSPADARTDAARADTDAPPPPDARLLDARRPADAAAGGGTNDARGTGGEDAGRGDAGRADAGGGAPSDGATAEIIAGDLTGVHGLAPSPDGTVVYFSQVTGERGALFSLPAEGGAPTLVSAGLSLPTDLVVSLDGGTIYVVDLGDDTPGLRGGTIRALPATGGVPRTIEHTRGLDPRGLDLAVSADGAPHLYFSGRGPRGEAATIFRLSLPDGPAEPLVTSPALTAPDAVSVDPGGAVYLVDALGSTTAPAGVFRATGEAAVRLPLGLAADTPVALARRPGHVFVAGAGAARAPLLLSVDPATDRERLLTVAWPASTGAPGHAPCGLRAALAAPVLVLCLAGPDGTNTLLRVTGVPGDLR
jgi:hypothetical protein